MAHVIVDPNHTRADKLVLQSLDSDIDRWAQGKSGLSKHVGMYMNTRRLPAHIGNRLN